MTNITKATLAKTKTAMKNHGTKVVNLHNLLDKIVELGGGWGYKINLDNIGKGGSYITLHNVKWGDMWETATLYYCPDNGIRLTHGYTVPQEIADLSKSLLEKLTAQSIYYPDALDLFKNSSVDYDGKLQVDITETTIELDTDNYQDGYYAEHRLIYNPVTGRVSQHKPQHYSHSYLVALNID